MIGACSSQKASLPQVGKAALPNIFLPDDPVFTPLTQEEYDKIPITAKGKILKFDSDVIAYCDIARTAVREYRSFISDLFDKEGQKQ